MIKMIPINEAQPSVFSKALSHLVNTEPCGKTVCKIFDCQNKQLLFLCNLSHSEHSCDSWYYLAK